MKNNNLTYQKSGVNIKAADNFVKFISSLSKKTENSKNFQNIGGFGSITNIPKNVKNPQIVASTDGVGTKIEIANELGKFNTIGIDLVAMCVNDLIVQGATPLIFLDYISINKIELIKAERDGLEIKTELKRFAKEGWESNSDLIPEGSVVFEKVEQDIKDQQKTTGLTDGQKFAKFVLFGMAMHSGIVAFFP